MDSNVIIIKTGSFTINDHAIDFEGFHVSLDKMSAITPIFEFERHSILFGVKIWFKIFVGVILIYAFYHNLSSLYGDLYILVLFLLLIGNVYCYFKRRFYGISIVTSGATIQIKSKSIVFLSQLKTVLDNAIDSHSNNYFINIDECLIENYGIINKGNRNINKVNSVKKNDKK